MKTIDNIDENLRNTLNMLAIACHNNAADKGFWDDVLDTKLTASQKALMLAGKIALQHSESSEALELLRLSDMPMSKKIPEHSLLAEKLADGIIRHLDLAVFFNVDIGKAVTDKIKYNASRPFMHGKLF